MRKNTRTDECQLADRIGHAVQRCANPLMRKKYTHRRVPACRPYWSCSPAVCKSINAKKYTHRRVPACRPYWSCSPAVCKSINAKKIHAQTSASLQTVLVMQSSGVQI